MISLTASRTENILLHFAYNYAKNSIILSQTYYYTAENEKDKIYLSEEIKNNKWLTNPEFWEEFIQIMIQSEFNRLENDTNFPIIDINKKEHLTEEVKTKLNDVVFSQLLVYIANMIFFIELTIIICIIKNILYRFIFI